MIQNIRSKLNEPNKLQTNESTILITNEKEE